MCLRWMLAGIARLQHDSYSNGISSIVFVLVNELVWYSYISICMNIDIQVLWINAKYNDNGDGDDAGNDDFDFIE